MRLGAHKTEQTGRCHSASDSQRHEDLLIREAYGTERSIVFLAVHALFPACRLAKWIHGLGVDLIVQLTVLFLEVWFS